MNASSAPLLLSNVKEYTSRNESFCVPLRITLRSHVSFHCCFPFFLPWSHPHNFVHVCSSLTYSIMQLQASHGKEERLRLMAGRISGGPQLLKKYNRRTSAMLSILFSISYVLQKRPFHLNSIGRENRNWDDFYFFNFDFESYTKRVLWSR